MKYAVLAAVALATLSSSVSAQTFAYRSNSGNNNQITIEQYLEACRYSNNLNDLDQPPLNQMTGEQIAAYSAGMLRAYGVQNNFTANDLEVADVLCRFYLAGQAGALTYTNEQINNMIAAQTEATPVDPVPLAQSGG